LLVASAASQPLGGGNHPILFWIKIELLFAHGAETFPLGTRPRFLANFRIADPLKQHTNRIARDEAANISRFDLPVLQFGHIHLEQMSQALS